MNTTLDRRPFFAKAGLAAAGLALTPRALLAALAKEHKEKKRPNILFIGFDDLRCGLGCYGDPEVKTPHIDAFAREGMTFLNAHVQQAVCAASRASFLTGCRPDTTTADYPDNDYFRKEFLKEHPTIPYDFCRNGYYTTAFGKIHHGAPLFLNQLSEPYYSHRRAGSKVWQAEHYAREENIALANEGKPMPPTECADVPDDRYPDGRIADGVIASMKRAAQQDKPFFMAVGFLKPHLPFNAPKKYWDMYDREEISLSPNPEQPDGAPDYALATYELPTYAEKWGTKENPITPEQARELRHGYYACTSYVDAQFGKVMQALDEVGLRDNTIVMLWSDHGWHLGDNGCWGKHTNYERATRAPLIVSAPGMPNKGTKCDALVEYVDMYPTLLDLSGREIPDYMEGTSLVPLLKDPKREWKNAVFSQFPRGKEPAIEGFAIRTDRYRYVEWRSYVRGNNGDVIGRELYDHTTDPNESVNIAARKPEVVKELAGRLKAGWKAALPPAAKTTPAAPSPEAEKAAVTNAKTDVISK